MQQVVSITSQGQITIPAAMRAALGLNKYNKAIVKQYKDKIMVEPVEDVLDFKGSLKHKAIQEKTIGEIIKIEEQAWEEVVIERYKRSFKNKKQ